MNPIIARMIVNSGRSWWQVRYTDGKILSEWDTLTDRIRLPIGLGRTSRWEEVKKDRIAALRLLCPNGMAGDLDAPYGHFFQLKQGFIDVSMSGGGSHRSTAAHIIGVLTDANGGCHCRAWETQEWRLITFDDNVLDIKYRGIGRLNLDVQGLKV